MSIASKKAQQSSAATTSGTGGSGFFRRKKIVPAEVARKLSNNNTKNTAKTASSKESAKNVQTQEETSAAPKAATEMMVFEQQNAQTVEAEKVVTVETDTLGKGESNAIKNNQTASSKPAAAFRRIKPKVIIPQSQKPAKSILKNSKTPVKESCSSMEKTGSSEVHPDDEIGTVKDLPTQTSSTEESVISIQTAHDVFVDSALNQTDIVVESKTTQQTSEDVAKADEERMCIDVQNCTDLKNGQSSLPAVSPEATSSPNEKNDNVTPESIILVTEDTSRQHIRDALVKPETTPSITVPAVATKTIKRAISVNKLSPQIADLLKSSLGKKVTKGTKPLSGKATPDVAKQVASLRTASQANQENQSTQLIVAVESDKPPSEKTISESAAGARLTVLETRLENISPKGTVTSVRPPSPVKTAPNPEKKTESSGQTTGAKRIQKVHQLTDKQRQLVLDSLKKGKVKRAIKAPDAAEVTKDNNAVALHGAVESTPLNPPTNQPTVLPFAIVPPGRTVSGVSTDECRVNIISHIILPRLPSVGIITQQPAGSVPVHTASEDTATTVSSPLSQQLMELAAGTSNSATVSTNNANQYPKVFICHQAAPAAPSFSPLFATPASPVRMNAPVVSLTVVPNPLHASPQYPSFMNAVPTRVPTNFLPEPIVTVRPTSAKHLPYANTPPPPLPTPNVTVTATPMKSSTSLPIPMDVPVDPRIVPKIVIDGCDAVDHDSQSSLTSSSSSSSSGNNTAAPKQQSKARSNTVKLKAKDHGHDVGTGCSPNTLDKLRAKSLKNLRMKSEGQMCGVLDTNANVSPIRQYGRTSGERSNLQSKADPYHTITMQKIKECISKKMEPETIEMTSNVVTKRATDVSVAPNASAKSCEQQTIPEMNEFLGFSTNSIESTERDFESRARTIDLMLEATRRESLEAARGNEVTSVEIETNDSSEESKRGSTSPMPMEEVMEELEEKSVSNTNAAPCTTLSTSSNDPNRTVVPEPQTSSKCADTILLQDEREMNTRKIEPQATPLQDEGAAVSDLPTPSKAASDVCTVIILDSDDEELENAHVASSNDQPVRFGSLDDSNRSVEDVAKIVDGTASGEASEADNSVERNDEMMVEGEDTAIDTAPDLIDQGATGVDVIVAMAKLRRANRVMSQGDENERDTVGWMDESNASMKPTLPSTSGSKNKKKRGRRKKRDEFVELLLKHVNYDALIEDVVRQEKRRCNYVSSSDEEVRTISPLQRYIREQKREQERSVAIVESDTDCSSPMELSEDEGSLIEQTILNRVLTKLNKLGGCGVSTDTAPKTTTFSATSNSSTSQEIICSGSGIHDDQREDVQRSIICDKAADEAIEKIKNEQTSRESMPVVEMAIADPMPQFSPEHNKSCDTIETNATTCDTRSGDAVVKKAPPEVAETINTQANQAQAARRTRKTVCKRVVSRKRSIRRLGKRMSRCTIQQKRLKYSITPPVELPALYDSSDASNNEVVSDCSSGGLSIGEVMANSTLKTLPVSSNRTDGRTLDNGNEGSIEGRINVDDGGVKDEDHPVVGEAGGMLNRSGRSRNGRRRLSSSSNSISSSARHNSLSCDGDLSSSDDTKPGNRRKLRRKKRSVRGDGTHAGIVATVDCHTNPSMSTTASSSTSNVSSLLPTASHHSKASNLDAQYVITEAAGESATGPPRVLDVITVRNNRVLSTGSPSTRSHRSSNVQPAESQPHVPGKDGLGRNRKRSAKANQSANVDSEFINPNNTINWQQHQSTANENESGSSELMDAVEDENRLVKCGKCGKEMLQSCWQAHSNLHNGATFRVGIDYPFDLKDVKAVAAAIGRFMKLERRAEVACERCGTVKKSGLGMASHMNSCGLSDLELEQAKASCEHCGRKMKAVSLLIHQQQHCRVLKEKQRQIALTTPCEDEIVTKETTASGRKKRKSVASAEQKIKTLAKEINDELYSELVLEIYGRGVSNAIMQCWLSHLKQSSEAVCAYIGCPFVGMTSENMRTEYNNDGIDPKPLYQCAKCAYMAPTQKPIHEHLAIVHPQTLQKVAEQRRTTSNFASDSESDALMGSGDGSTSADDTYSSSALEEDDDGGHGKTKKGKGKKGTGASSKSKSKKNGECPKGSSKKTTGKQAGNKAISECLDSSIGGGGTEETEVYKEMVLQESIEYKQGKGNYHLMTVNWTHEFHREHYAARLLFSELRPDLDTSYLRSVSNVKDYLPKVTHSMRYVQCNSKQYDPGYEPGTFANRWQQKNTFDGEALGCESMFFCGGPVVSLDWLPLPDDCGRECDQFLAVACKQNFDEYYSGEDLAVTHSRKCLVQIWNVGPIENLGSAKVTLRCPRLAFAIACEYGPIWQVAFCPSGCYNDPAKGDDLDRLGLLAVAGSDGDVHLYALSRSMVGAENEPSTVPRILHLRPVLLLSLSLTVGSKTHPAADFTGRSVVRITWTRERGHNVLAAGYSNGVVAVWNLATTSPLLCGTKNGIRTLLPVHKLLHSSSGCITALDLHYSSGSRYLVVCNADRRMKVYDLRCNLYQPQESLSIVMRSRISAVRWLLHFPVLVIAYDDALYIDRCAYSVHQPRDIGLRMFSIFTIGSDTTDLGTNDWYSMNAVATSGGDLVCHRPVPFVYGMNYKKLAQILTTTIPVKISAIDDSADVSRYKAFCEEYGLLLSDTDKVPTAMDTAALHLKTWHRNKFNHYPGVRLNQIRWNPNSFSYMYYAIGYQAGFVRVRVLRT